MRVTRCPDGLELWAEVQEQCFFSIISTAQLEESLPDLCGTHRSVEALAAYPASVVPSEFCDSTRGDLCCPLGSRYLVGRVGSPRIGPQLNRFLLIQRQKNKTKQKHFVQNATSALSGFSLPVSNLKLVYGVQCMSLLIACFFFLEGRFAFHGDTCIKVRKRLFNRSSSSPGHTAGPSARRGKGTAVWLTELEPAIVAVNRNEFSPTFMSQILILGILRKSKGLWCTFNFNQCVVFKRHVTESGNPTSKPQPIWKHPRPSCSMCVPLKRVCENT